MQDEKTGWLAVPPPVKRVFDRFPLATYPPNAAPASSSGGGDGEHRLYVFASAQAAARGRPSVNPQCLKYQAYLRFAGVPFRAVASNNHASPDGALPFLLPASGTDPVPASKLQKWTEQRTGHAEEGAGREQAYAALLDHRIRDAWLYTVYLDGANFASIARKAYVESATSNPLVQTVLAYQLQEAARRQLLRVAPYVDADDILAEAKSAFDALAVLLAGDDHFFGRASPGSFDAAVFAYTHLVLDPGLGWNVNPLAAYVKRHPNLVQHRERLLAYF